MTMDSHSRKSKAHLGRSSLTRDDGHSYFDAVQAEFHDQPEVYAQLLAIMKQFRRDEISTSTVMQRVADLLKGHPALIQGFNVFLPPGVTMDTSTSSPGPSTLPSLRSTQVKAVDRLDEIYSIIRFADKVRQRCVPEVYEDFVDILSQYYHRMYDSDQEDVLRKLKALFVSDADLFERFLLIMGNNGDHL